MDDILENCMDNLFTKLEGNSFINKFCYYNVDRINFATFIIQIIVLAIMNFANINLSFFIFLLFDIYLILILLVLFGKKFSYIKDPDKVKWMNNSLFKLIMCFVFLLLCI